MLTLAEYIWLDGARPTQQLRSKTRIVDMSDDGEAGLADFPEWGFDGSSTNQADGSDSDRILRPVRFVDDPLRDGGYLVMCEVYNPDGTPHASNTRAGLRAAIAAAGEDADPWIGFEQEYNLFDAEGPLGFPKQGFPGPQGPYYCGVGADRAFGRPVAEAHMRACLDAGLMIYGVNAEVMPGQWEFQIGYRGVSTESADPLRVADHVWLGRWLLQRVGEDHGLTVSFDNKPMKGDWNGAGMHTNFSTRAMRNRNDGRAQIDAAIERLALRHELHIAEYGADLAERLTGLHETCSIHEFRGGVADRGASVRIPRSVEERGYGYLEDRRPGANADPYRVARLLIEAVAEAGASKADQGAKSSEIDDLILAVMS